MESAPPPRIRFATNGSGSRELVLRRVGWNHAHTAAGHHRQSASTTNQGTLTEVEYDDADLAVNWILVIAFALIGGAAVAALALIIDRRLRRPMKRDVTVTQEDSRSTQVDELRNAQKRVADLEEIVEDLIMVIGPGASTLLWSLRAARANEAPDHESAFDQESLTAQIERLTVQIRAFESTAGEVIEPNHSASGEPADLVAPTERPPEGVPLDAAAGAEAPVPTTAPDEPVVVAVSPTQDSLHVDPSERAASPSVSVELDIGHPVHLERDDEGSAPGEEARWLRFDLVSSDAASREPSSSMEQSGGSSISRSSIDSAETTTSDAVVAVELCRDDDTPLVVDLSEPTSADLTPNRTTRQPSSG